MIHSHGRSNELLELGLINVSHSEYFLHLKTVSVSFANRNKFQSFFRRFAMRITLVALLLAIKFTFCAVDELSDAVLNKIKSDGYKGQRYQIETEDGYLLTVHRVTSRIKTSSHLPVFLLHGLFATSKDFILTGPQNALAYLLADNGYDVWIGNARGNNYSTSHKTLSPKSEECWKFSWHEIGYYDLPAMIDHMLSETKSSKALYVGYSQGTTSLLVLLSTRPEYNKKIAQAHLLAPAAFMKNERTPQVLKTLGNEVANGLLDEYFYLNFEDYWDLGEKLSNLLCIERQTKICDKIYFAVFGANENGIKIDNVSLCHLTF